MRIILVGFVVALTVLAQNPRTREVDELNWMEFKDLVPGKINTVLIPTGTLEAHNVTHNGADNTVPTAIARRITPSLNALVAPTLNYGIIGSLEAFVGGITISDEAYRLFVPDLLRGFARHGMKNLMIVNGHGGNTAALNAVAEEVGRRERVRTLIVNWWTYCGDLTLNAGDAASTRTQGDVQRQDGISAGNSGELGCISVPELHHFVSTETGLCEV